MKSYDFAGAAKRLGVTTHEVVRMVEQHELGIVYLPGGGRIPKDAIDLVIRKREAKVRQAAIGDARALQMLPGQIAEEERFLASVGQSWSRKLEGLKAELARRDGSARIDASAGAFRPTRFLKPAEVDAELRSLGHSWAGRKR